MGARVRPLVDAGIAGGRRVALAVLGALALSACSISEPDPPYVDFAVSVVGETFVLRATDPETIRLARENREGRNSHFPIGRLNRSNGGFNAPWSWSLDPDDVRMTEVAIEVCDGRPSYVEGHLADYPTYCPWGARVIGERGKSGRFASLGETAEEYAFLLQVLGIGG